jgi:hypothetical protein
MRFSERGGCDVFSLAPPARPILLPLCWECERALAKGEFRRIQRAQTSERRCPTGLFIARVERIFVAESAGRAVEIAKERKWAPKLCQIE